MNQNISISKRYPLERLKKYNRKSFSDKNDCDEDSKKINEYKQNIPSQGHIPYYQSIIDFLNGNSKEVIDGEEGLKSLELIEASYLSSKKSERIDLPLFNKGDLS